ncbi:MAG: HAD hydrolase-like protein [Desulfobacteraceae bacterium]
MHHPTPHPEHLQVILDHFEITPDRMIYIGDSDLDARSAGAANVPFIAYRNASLPARLHIQSLRQIEDILGL